MGKRLTLILACALIVGLAMPAYAEVQNIKVSGDILMQYVDRQRTDFQSGGNGNDEFDDMVSAFTSQVRLRVDADLTENVSAVVRLINERIWSSDLEETDTVNAQDAGIDLDLAYISLKEFLYEPLTLIIGRQNLRYGNGFIVGDPDTNQFSQYNHYSGVQLVTFLPEDLSLLKAFDAIRAILNYDPMVIDLLFAKIDEDTTLSVAAVTPGTRESDDIDLWGVNVAYDWGGDKNLATESYVFTRETSSDGNVILAPGGGTAMTDEDNSDSCVTVGTRAHLEPIERLYLAGEIAMQLGDKYIAAGQSRERKAFAWQLISQYALDMKYSPVLTAQYTHYSGDKNPGAATDIGRYKAWDPMFEDSSGGKLYNALFPASNCNTLEFMGQVTPMEDVNLTLAYAILWLDVAFNSAATTWNASDIDGGTYAIRPDNRDLGHEVDLVLTYDYTEDVQFGLNTGIFLPGDVFAKNQQENAFQCIGSVKVSF